MQTRSNRINRSSLLVLSFHFWSQVQEWLLSHNVCIQMDLQPVLLDLKNHDQAIGNMIILFDVVFLFREISVAMVQIESLKTLVRHHSQIERSFVKGNSKMVITGKDGLVCGHLSDGIKIRGIG